MGKSPRKSPKRVDTSDTPTDSEVAIAPKKRGVVAKGGVILSSIGKKKRSLGNLQLKKLAPKESQGEWAMFNNDAEYMATLETSETSGRAMRKVKKADYNDKKTHTFGHDTDFKDKAPIKKKPGRKPTVFQKVLKSVAKPGGKQTKPGGKQTVTKPGGKPKGRPPKGCEWDEAKGVYVDSSGAVHEKKAKTKQPVVADEDGKFKKPKGRPPHNAAGQPMVWSAAHGRYY